MKSAWAATAKPGPAAQPRRSLLAVLIAGAVIGIGHASAAEFNVSQVPLYLGGTIEPNLMYIHDDSGSMYWSFMPDETYGSFLQQRARSSHFNKVYYDPAVVYPPPLNDSGASLGNASFTAAWFDGYQLDSSGAHTSSVVDLSTNFQATWYYTGWIDAVTGPQASARYFVFNGANVGCDVATLNDACFTRVIVGATSGPGTSDLNGDGKIDDADKDERQNFANWYSYYRTRNYAAKAGVSRAFATLGSGIRIGYGRINKSTAATVDGKSLSTIERGVRTFSGTDRKAFFDWLFGLQPTAATPLRRALDASGQYFENDSSIGPWSTTPGTSGGTNLSCRHSYTILMTDGYWNDAEAATAAARENVDGTAGPTVTAADGKSSSYAAVSPFTDSYSNTLADIAMHYWKRDLRTDMANRVPVSVLDPAFWQHMVTFGIGLGVEGAVDPDEAFASIGTDKTITWPNGASSQVDDLLHASVNGRGAFFSAKNPNEFASALSSTLAKIADRTSSSSAVATNSNRLSSGSLIYQVTFESAGWTGEISAFKLDTRTGDPANTATWTASSLLPSASKRNILTWRPDLSPAEGTNFNWSDISAAQRTALTSEDVLNWLRGDQSKEKSFGGPLRNRSKVLGDIINSDPYFVGNEDYGYGSSGMLSTDIRAAYVTRKFSTAFKGRKKMLYVGANDGMLHGFNAETGVEEFAYVPNVVGYGNLFSLSQPAYTHRYLVDGPPRAADAHIRGRGESSPSWKTVLVGSTGAGGKGYFALDVDNPGAMDKTKVLWEFSHAELGLAIGQAAIVLGENGQWLAIFGNGYNSTSGKAQLFIVDLETGALVKTIDTGVGCVPVKSGACTTDPNGLATPLAIDTDQNGAVDLVYAGDMYGNMWKFNLSGENVSSWGIPFSDKGVSKPLFSATYGSARQPITAKPQASRNRSGGVIVYFGTGQFFEVGDQGDTSEQTFYGIIDKCGRETSGECAKATGGAHVLRSTLLQQTIDVEKNGTFDEVTWDARVLSNNKMTDAHKGFYIDLISPALGKQGERVVSAPLVWDDRVIFVTQIPDPDPCAYGGESWIMEIDPKAGGRTSFAVFDMNADARYDGGDSMDGKVVNGRKVPGGLAKTPATVSGGGSTYKYTMGSAAVLGKTANKQSIGIGRQSWRQLR
jgi:type IV pilus assembly protein PilY1